VTPSTRAPSDTAAAPAVLSISLEALAANYAALCRIAAPARVAAVVKGNAYGLGVGPVAERLVAAGCRDFFVGPVAEGLELRRLQPDSRIFVLGGGAGAAIDCLACRLTPVLNSLADVRDWVAAAGRAPAALQIDSGMTRAGLGAAEIEELCAEPGLLARLTLELVMTHLACADQPEHRQNALQLQRFATLSARLPRVPQSIGNSAGTLLGPAYRGDLVRPGIALYGGRPFAHGANPMTEVVRLEARVLQIHELDRDAAVGYGAEWTARAPARIAIVAAGYADGYPRSLGGKGFAFAAGRRIPVAGRVSMDLVTLDVSAVPPEALRPGDYVELLGGGVPLEEAAELAGTVNYELLTRLAPRLARRWY
jgi:alanine racemase